MEHVRHSKCREDFIQRVKQNARLRQEACAKGEYICLKRQPKGPRPAHIVTVDSLPETVRVSPYETTL